MSSGTSTLTNVLHKLLLVLTGTTVAAVAAVNLIAGPVQAAPPASPASASYVAATPRSRAVAGPALSLTVKRKSGAIRVTIRSSAKAVRLVATLGDGARVTRRARVKRVVRVDVPISTVGVKVAALRAGTLKRYKWTSINISAALSGSAGSASGSTGTAPAGGGSSSPVNGEQAAYEADVFRLTNEARLVARKCGSTSYPAAAAFHRDGRLDLAARNHSTDMGVHNYFSHTSLEGTAPWDRITAAGYTWRAAGENIAKGYPTAESVVTGWINSPGHCLNLMSSSFRDMGVGVYKSASGQWLATQDFAAH